jgi:hypothetical protein
MFTFIHFDNMNHLANLLVGASQSSLFFRLARFLDLNFLGLLFLCPLPYILIDEIAYVRYPRNANIVITNRRRL